MTDINIEQAYIKPKTHEELATIALETIAICNAGYYELGDKLTLLTDSDDVVVYSPELLAVREKNLARVKHLNFINNINNPKYSFPLYSVVNKDSFEAAKGYKRPFVMNFANAYIPGGGFLSGSRAQEESLCRNSNLYKSLTTEKASEMYKYNMQHRELSCYSDYMLLSNNVCVFRNSDNELLEEPYLVDVITIAAPNKKGEARNVEQKELYSVMKNRLRHMLHVAINNGNKTLVLGAWGCGAFGNSTEEVAQIFYELLCEEHYEIYFENIIFAIYNDIRKLEIFKNMINKIQNRDCIKTIKELNIPIENSTHSNKKDLRILGAIIGDIVGSIYEFDNIKTKDFELLSPDCFITDDSVMTIAIFKALLNCKSDFSDLDYLTIKYMRTIARKYPDCSYGIGFNMWVYSDDPQPYDSFGNGAAMRVSGCGYAANSIEEAKVLSKAVTAVTHNHPEGIKGAESVAVAIYLARSGKTLDEIRNYINLNYYPITYTLDDIRANYKYDITCQGCVPQAFEAFFESDSFEDAIRNAISIGGDSDTIGAITGAIASAYYGIPDKIKEQITEYLDDNLLKIVLDFEDKYGTCKSKEVL